jgi:Uri superfamily endonuclease
MNSINHSAIPASPGVYILHLVLMRQRAIKVGKFGEVQYLPGDYLYVGSARGPGGLRSRLGRHLEGNGQRHWHIDWLRAATTPGGYIFLETDKPLECTWSQAILRLPGASIPMNGFGASDCQGRGESCAAHLVFFSSGFDVNSISSTLPGENGSIALFRNYFPD